MILAAGYGRRLGALTASQPKTLLPVAGRSVLDWILLWLKAWGIEAAVVNLYHGARAVEEHFETVPSPIPIRYSDESDEPGPLGTAGALKLARRDLGQTCLVTFGDVLTDMPVDRLAETHRAGGSQPHLTLSTYRRPRLWECGVVETDGNGRVRAFVEKPDKPAGHLAFAGPMILDTTLLDFLPNGTADLGRDFIPALLREEIPVYAVPPEGGVYVRDVGNYADLCRARAEWPTETFRELMAERNLA